MVQLLARLPGKQEVRGLIPGPAKVNFCTPISIYLYHSLHCALLWLSYNYSNAVEHL